MVETDVELAVMKLYFVVFYLAAGDTLPPLLPRTWPLRGPTHFS